ncbi:MAG TPA: L,D-transpeptidase family protein [Chitinophagaceae bacterium]|nr:L,D-transpeptidase family protein [Chitinophagaceae bacterium]
MIEQKTVVEQPAQIDVYAEDILQETLSDLVARNGRLDDSTSLRSIHLIRHLYESGEFKPLWSAKGVFRPRADSLLRLLDSVQLLGFLDTDYHIPELRALHGPLRKDTAKQNRLDASLWSRADLLLTSAFVELVKDLKVGRIQEKRDSLLSEPFFAQQLERFSSLPTDSFVAALEPKHRGYHELKAVIPRYLDSADLRPFTFVRGRDSAERVAVLMKRLREEDSTIVAGGQPDSLQLASAIRSYQKMKGWKVDGKYNGDLLNRVNNTGRYRFLRIGMNLDRYKQLPDTLPGQYIWVNIPEAYLQLMNADTVALVSKVVVGKPNTRTPLITSAISDMITYPQWTIPASIIEKEILPALKRDPNYTNRKGYSLVDKDGNVVNPHTVDWSKYKKGIPYKVVQGSGDANALGVIKFNFPNKHSVYLHDTNQRYLFARKARALSHGCVRVESWKALADYILTNDSLFSELATPRDSLDAWLSRKEKRVIPVRKRVPLYIRYFTCGAKNGKVVFYDDVYGEDKRLRERYFALK